MADSNYSPLQLAAASIIKTDHVQVGTPQVLDVQSSSAQATDIIIPGCLLDESGSFVSLAGTIGLRGSLEKTLDAVLRKLPCWADIEADTAEAPKFFLHGCESLDLEVAEEIWTTQARTTSWASVYSLASRVRDAAESPAQLALPGEEVLGRVLLMTLDEAAYSKGLALHHFEANEVEWEAAANCVVDEAASDKIVARRHYLMTRYFGSFNWDEPDAYVFRGGVIGSSGLKVLHEYRILAPRMPTDA